MNKIIKIMVSAAVLAVLAGGNTFARSRNMEGKRKSHNVQSENVSSNIRMNIKRGYNRRNSDIIEDKVLIGIVKSIDDKNGKLTLINSDGKDVSVIVNPFTVIFSDEKKEKTFSNIKIGKWVKVSLFKTETEIPVAARISIEE